MWKLGWDYFDGYLDGAPYPIDTRAGRSNVAEGTHKCGFVANTTMDSANGADTGACYAVTGACESITRGPGVVRSEEHTSELQSLMRISYAVFCLKKKKH